MAINRYRNASVKKNIHKRLGLAKDEDGNKLLVGTVPKRWQELAKERKFKISEKCCDVLKKGPLKAYSKRTGRWPIIATRKAESNQRNLSLDTFNIFDENPRSTPIQFWSDENIWNYIKKEGLEISELYTKFGYERNGCWGCLFGCYPGGDENRMLKLEQTHPKLHEYLELELGYYKICRAVGVRFSKDEKHFGSLQREKYNHSKFSKKLAEALFKMGFSQNFKCISFDWERLSKDGRRWLREGWSLAKPIKKVELCGIAINIWFETSGTDEEDGLIEIIPNEDGVILSSKACDEYESLSNLNVRL